MNTKRCQKCNCEFYVMDSYGPAFVPKHGDPVPQTQQYCNPCLAYLRMQSGENEWPTDNMQKFIEMMKPTC